MNYNVFYSTCSVFFLFITIFFYFSKKRFIDKKNIIFKWMLITAFMAVVFDAASASMEKAAENFPTIILATANMLFILGMHTCLILFVYYLVIFTNITLSKTLKVLIILPYAVLITALVLSFFTKWGIFYIDINHIYQGGTLHSLVYINTVLYLAIGAFIIYLKRRIIRSVTKASLLLAIVLLLGFVIVQIMHPEYLLTASATAMGVSVMYFVLQMPSQYLDSATGTYNRVALYPILKELYLKKKPFKVTLFSVHSLNQIGRLHGSSVQTNVVNEVAKMLGTYYPQAYICHLYFTNYVVISPNGVDSALSHEEVLANFNKGIKVDDIVANLPISVTDFTSSIVKDAQTLINMIDYLLHEKLDIPNSVVQITEDDVYKYELYASLSKNFANLLKNDKLQFKKCAIYDASHKVIAFEIVPYIATEAYRNITYNDLLKVAKDNDLEEELTKRVFSLLINDSLNASASEEIMIKIPTTIFTTSEGIKIILDYLGKYAPKISFIFPEKECAEMHQQTLDNLMILINEGFKIILDDFGVGYTNSTTLLYLELFAVRINQRNISATFDEKTLATFLSLLLNITKQIDVHLIYAGVTSQAEISKAKELGVKYYQN